MSIVISAVISIGSVLDIGRNNSDQILLLLCQTGEKNLDSYFEGIEHSVGIVSSFAETDLKENISGNL